MWPKNDVLPQLTMILQQGLLMKPKAWVISSQGTEQSDVPSRHKGSTAFEVPNPKESDLLLARWLHFSTKAR